MTALRASWCSLAAGGCNLQPIHATCANGKGRPLPETSRNWGRICPHRRETLVATTSLALLLDGRPHEAAAALEALAAASAQHATVARVAAAAMVDAVDGGAAGAVAEASAQLWGCGLTPLLRDVMTCAARRGWADAAAKVSRQALERGHGQMVADVSAALVVEGAVEEAAQLAAHLAMAANFSPAAIQVAIFAPSRRQAVACHWASLHPSRCLRSMLNAQHAGLLCSMPAAATVQTMRSRTAEFASPQACTPLLPLGTGARHCHGGGCALRCGRPCGRCGR